MSQVRYEKKKSFKKDRTGERLGALRGLRRELEDYAALGLVELGSHLNILRRTVEVKPDLLGPLQRNSELDCVNSAEPLIVLQDDLYRSDLVGLHLSYPYRILPTEVKKVGDITKVLTVAIRLGKKYNSVRVGKN